MWGVLLGYWGLGGGGTRNIRRMKVQIQISNGKTYKINYQVDITKNTKGEYGVKWKSRGNYNSGG